MAPAQQSVFVCHLWAAIHSHRAGPAIVMLAYATSGVAACFRVSYKSFNRVALPRSTVYFTECMLPTLTELDGSHCCGGEARVVAERGAEVS